MKLTLQPGDILRSNYGVTLYPPNYNEVKEDRDIIIPTGTTVIFIDEAKSNYVLEQGDAKKLWIEVLWDGSLWEACLGSTVKLYENGEYFWEKVG